MTFTCFVFFDMFNALGSRSHVRYAFVVWFLYHFSDYLLCISSNNNDPVRYLPHMARDLLTQEC